MLITGKLASVTTLPHGTFWRNENIPDLKNTDVTDVAASEGIHPVEIPDVITISYTRKVGVIILNEY